MKKETEIIKQLNDKEIKEFNFNEEYKNRIEEIKISLNKGRQ